LIYLPSKGQVLYDFDDIKKGIIKFEGTQDPSLSFFDAMLTSKEMNSHLFCSSIHDTTYENDCFGVLRLLCLI